MVLASSLLPRSRLRLSIDSICQQAEADSPHRLATFPHLQPAAPGTEIAGSRPLTHKHHQYASTIKELESWFGLDTHGQDVRTFGVEALRVSSMSHAAIAESTARHRINADHTNLHLPGLDLQPCPGSIGVSGLALPRLTTTPPPRVWDARVMDVKSTRDCQEGSTYRRRRRRSEEIPRDDAKRKYSCEVPGCLSRFARPSALSVGSFYTCRQRFHHDINCYRFMDLATQRRKVGCATIMFLSARRRLELTLQSLSAHKWDKHVDHPHLYKPQRYIRFLPHIHISFFYRMLILLHIHLPWPSQSTCIVPLSIQSGPKNKGEAFKALQSEKSGSAA